MRVDEVTFTEASPNLVEKGMLGWASVVIEGALHVEGLQVRRTRSGRLSLSFPMRVDGRNRRHFVIRPISHAARREIERQVIGQLRLA